MMELPIRSYGRILLALLLMRPAAEAKWGAVVPVLLQTGLQWALVSAKARAWGALLLRSVLVPSLPGLTVLRLHCHTLAALGLWQMQRIWATD